MSAGWRRPLLPLLALLVAAGGGVALAAPNGGDVSSQCFAAAASAPDAHAQLPCKFGQGVTNQGGAYCRVADNADDQCAAVDGRDVSAAEIAAYESSWTHQALSLQRGLDAGAPLVEEQIPHTHNTFNTSAYVLPGDAKQPAYYPTLTNQDPNQAYSITDQLNMDVRFIELDLHWQPSPFGTAATHGYWVTMCHGDDGAVPGAPFVQLGCSADRPAQSALTEVRSWLDAHKDQFVFIYLENQLDGSPVADATLAHNTAASLLADTLGSLVYRPTGVAPGSCATLPYGTSRRQMMDAGARVVLVGNCGPGAWSSLVFQRGSAWDESGDPTTYSASNCAHDSAVRRSDVSFRREFEDSTFVSAATGTTRPPMSPALVAQMVRCGVNIIGMDQLRPQDGRLGALVWSWAVDQPAASGDCALQSSDGRFRTADCGQPRPAACRLGNGGWAVTSVPVEWTDATDECTAEFAGSSFAVPVNGLRNADLLQARPGGVAGVWLNYAKVHGAWTPGAAAMTGVHGGGGHGRGHAYGRGHGTGRPPGVPPNARLA